jgi:uncharacterized membrane protein
MRRLELAFLAALAMDIALATLVCAFVFTWACDRGSPGAGDGRRYWKLRLSLI